MKKVYIVTDLGPGDGGKGGVVHKIASQFNAHTIVKVGGAQVKSWRPRNVERIACF